MIGVRGILAGLALALGTSGAAMAASPSISAVNSAAAQTYLSDLDTMIATQQGESNLALANTGKGTGNVIWFDPLKDRANAFGYNTIAASDAEWMRSNVRLYEIYEQLGGNEIGKQQQFRTANGQFYVGLDGSGGKWFASNGEAQGYLLKLLIASSSEILPTVKQAVAALTSNDIGAVLTTARDAMAQGRTFLARGSNNTLIIKGSGFVPNGFAPKVVITGGVVVGPVQVDSPEQISVPVAVPQTVPTGDQPVLVYYPGLAIQAVYEFRVAIVRGDGTPTGTADDFGDTVATAGTLTIGTNLSGRIDSTADVDVFKLVVPATGTLTVQSGGTTDLLGELLDSGGNTVIATDDDAGSWYNFSLQKPGIAPGTYYLRVRHCCQGGGTYTISSSLN